MIAFGFHHSIGGNKTGSGAFIDKLNAAGIPVMMKGASDAGLCFEAQEKGKQYGVENILIWRATSDREDRADYWLAPSVAAAKKWGEIQSLWPPELDKGLVWWEVVNEPRKQDAPDEVNPTWGNMHTTAWLGLFLVEMAKLMNPAGYKLCGPSFSSGEPEPEDWQLEGMGAWLQYCADNPTKAAVSHHEYNYGSVPFSDNYPWHYGRFQSVIAAADKLGIPRTFSIFLTEMGWTYQTVPPFETAVPVLTEYAKLAAKFPQLKGVALWTLQTGWGDISNQLAAWISNQGNPLASWVINNQYPELPQPQPTAPEFGATLPEEEQQPPDGGGGTMTQKLRYSYDIELPRAPRVQNEQPVLYRLVAMEPDGAGSWKIVPGLGSQKVISVDKDKNYRFVLQFEVLEDEPTNPNPPPVVSNPLPQGALWVDVSANNKIVDLAARKAQGVQGVGIRLSNGIRKNTDTTDANGVDKMAFHYIEEAEALGMPWCGYHFANENYDDVAQVRHFLGIANQFIAAGHVPEMGLWIDFETPGGAIQGSPTTEARIQQQLTTLATERPSFILDYGPYTSKGWWDAKVPNALAWVPPLGLKAWAAAWVPQNVLVNGWPPSWWHPSNLKGFTSVHFWQWTSAGGFEVGHTVDSLDLNFVGNTAVVPGSQPPPPPPPPAQTYDTSFMRAEPGIWRVIRRADGSGEDVWELPLTTNSDVRVKNAVQGEWYEYRPDGVYRLRDTSPAPDSQGNERLYLLFSLSNPGTPGGKIAPAQAEVGVTYSYSNGVFFKSKDGKCTSLEENSGIAASTFLLKQVIDNYTFPGTGFKVDRLYWTVQTGENQFYVDHDGRRYGWCGGGANQPNNIWAGELSEVYYDRQIPQQEPPRYCS